MYHYFGAVLFNDAGEVLLRRPAAGDERGSWTFAERQGDEFHTPEETALEAVVEQIGYNCRLLGTVPGTFAHGNDFTEFFFMTPVGEQQPFLPELTEEIAWFTPEDASMRIGGLPMIREPGASAAPSVKVRWKSSRASLVAKT